MRSRDKEIKRIDEGGDAWHDSDEVVEIDVRTPLDKVIPVRLASVQYAELKKEAAALGVGPTTLARIWILEKLRSEPAAQSRQGTRQRRVGSGSKR